MDTHYRTVAEALEGVVEQLKPVLGLPRREDITEVHPGSTVPQTKKEGVNEDLTAMKEEDEVEEITEAAPSVNVKIFPKRDVPSPADVSNELAVATTDQMERDDVV